MNLLTDPWLFYRFRDGREEQLPLTALINPEIVDFALPRSDFQGAAYQFAIGVLQTLMAPADLDEWLDSYQSPPDLDTFIKILNKAEHAFNLVGDGPLFMQDFDPLADIKSSPVSGLLIEAPGGNTIKNNTDHFIKRGITEALSPEMAALALLTLQINAPAGGQGHRVGLRGGGPLTTLVLPQEENSPLWQKLWLNVIQREHWDYPDPDLNSPDIFPWLGPTKISKNKNTEIYHHEVHPLTLYWAMPRRIRLELTDEEGICQLSRRPSTQLVKTYRTSNYGNNYAGTWSHPLTHYRSNPKKPEEDHLSTKGQPGGIQYKQWQSLCFIDTEQGNLPAAVIAHYFDISRDLMEELENEWSKAPRLWAFGYDMDNMKARGWYASEFPLYRLNPEVRDKQIHIIRDLQKLAEETAWQLRTQIKNAWFEKPGDAKGDFSFIDLQFWQSTQAPFFATVQAILKNQGGWMDSPTATYWLQQLSQAAHQIFDQQVLTNLYPDREMHRKIKARRQLNGWLHGGKTVKHFKKNYCQQEEVA